MIKRIASSALWFLAAGWGLNFVAAMAGASQIPGLAVAAAVGLFVGMDPCHLFWPVAESTAAGQRDFESVPAHGALVAR